MSENAFIWAVATVICVFILAVSAESIVSIIWGQ
jgi:hypothetical protein